MHVLSQPERPSHKGIFEAALIFIVSTPLMLWGIWTMFNLIAALVVAICWIAFCAYVVFFASSPEVLYDPEKRKIVLQYRSPLRRLRREEFPLERFVAVASYYPYGGPAVRSVVCLMEQSGNRSLDIASFDVKVQYRSFSDLRPTMEESDEALELRSKLSSLLGVYNAGNLGARWNMKGSKV